MSTKIYDGLIANTKDPFEAARQIREVLDVIYAEKLVELYEIVEKHRKDGSTYAELNKEILILDYESFEEPSKTIISSDLTTVKIVEKLKSCQQRTMCNYDIGYNVTFIENGNKGENLLVLIYSAYNGYMEEILKSGVVSEYGYWNNTDEPDDVTEEEWEIRKKAWDKLDIPADDGVSFGNPSYLTSAGFIYDHIYKDKN